MKKSNRIITQLLAVLILFGMWHEDAKGQDVEVVHGVSIAFGFPAKTRILVSYNSYIRSHLEVKKDFAITPYLDVKVSLFKNHLGSNLKKSYSPLAYLNTAFTYGGLLSFSKYDSDVENESYYYVPTFTSVYHNTPNSSYKTNVGLGTTRSIQFAIGQRKGAKVKARVLAQEVSNIMLNISDFYMTYMNDGGDPLSSYFGDGRDRYWTAGMTIGYNLRASGDVHQLELGFDQFTGYNKSSYESAGLLHIGNVLYSDEEQFGYNTGRVSLKYLNLSQNVGGSIHLWNVGIQDMIHKYVTNSPYHSRFEKKFVDFEVLWNRNFNVND